MKSSAENDDGRTGISHAEQMNMGSLNVNEFAERRRLSRIPEGKEARQEQ
jgi:hypothetical protein